MGQNQPPKRVSARRFRRRVAAKATVDDVPKRNGGTNDAEPQQGRADESGISDSMRLKAHRCGGAGYNGSSLVG